MPFHWNMNPVLFQVGPLAVRWYGLFFAVSFLAGYKLMQWIYRREGRPEIEMESLFAYMFIGVLFGARLGHCLFYDPGFYLSHPIEILKIWEGGLASHGAALGILASLFVFTRRQRSTILSLAAGSHRPSRCAGRLFHPSGKFL